MIAGGIEKMKYRLSKRDQKSDIPPKPVIFVNTERERHRLATGEARRGGMRNPGFLFFVILEESFHGNPWPTCREISAVNNAT